MNNVYKNLSQELLKRIINKGNDLITRDISLSNTTFNFRENYIYPGTSITPSFLNNIIIDSNLEDLGGYLYTGNKGIYIPASTTSNKNTYIHEDSQSNIGIKQSFGKELVILNEFALVGINKISYKYITARNNNYLTPLLTWNVNDLGTPQLNNTYPLESYLFPSNALDWNVVWTLGVNEMTHPFLPYFLFTGLVICAGQYKNIMYEYTDTKGLYGNKFNVYISSLKPVELDYPLGFPREDMLEKDYCYSSLIDEYPKEGFIDRDLGGYTGLVTTSSYHPIYKFYLYIRSNYSLFLSSRPPYKGIKEFVLNERTKKNLVRNPFTLPTVEIPPINIINDGETKEYIYKYKLHEL